MIKLSIIYNNEKESAINIYKELLEFLKSKKEFEILDEENLHKASYIVTIGGDGTLLRAFRNIKNKKAKIIAINSGTLGYLTEIRKDKYKEIFENILRNKISIEERFFFMVNIGNRRYKALNEVFLTRDTIKRNIVARDLIVKE